jgi:hypothetical protein
MTQGDRHSPRITAMPGLGWYADEAPAIFLPTKELIYCSSASIRRYEPMHHRRFRFGRVAVLRKSSTFRGAGDFLPILAKFTDR